MEGPWPEDVDGGGLCTGITGSGKVADSTWHLENPSHPYLVALLYCSCSAVLRSPVLDLRCKEENRLGFLCAACRLKYIVDLPAAGLLRLPHWPRRYHLSRYAFQLRLAGRRENSRVHRFHSCDRCASDPVQSPAATIKGPHTGDVMLDHVHP